MNRYAASSWTRDRARTHRRRGEGRGGGAQRGRDGRQQRVAVWRRSFSSSTSSRRRIEGGAGTSVMAGHPGARPAPTSSNQEANEWEAMSRREREVVCIFSSNNGAFYRRGREHGRCPVADSSWLGPARE
jgi:hypothetical protein